MKKEFEYRKELLLDDFKEKVEREYQHDKNRFIYLMNNYEINEDLKINESLELAKTFEELEASSRVPELLDDIVFGNDNWTAKERFNMQKRQLNAAICATYARDLYNEIGSNIKTSIDETQKARPLKTKIYNVEFDEKIMTEDVNKHLGVSDEKVNEYSKRLNPTSVIGFGLGLYFGILSLIIYFAIRTKYPVDYLLYIGIIFTVIGLISGIYTRIFKSKRRNYFINKAALLKQIKEELQPEKEKIIENYQNKYHNLTLSTDSKFDNVIEEQLKLLDEVKEKEKKCQETLNEYVFCRNLSFNKLNKIYETMENGLADSYTQALIYVNDQEQKTLDRAEEKQHREKLEQISLATLASQKRQEEAAISQARAAQEAAHQAAIQAKAAEDAAYYSRRQQEELAKQSKTLEKQKKELEKLNK